MCNILKNWSHISFILQIYFYEYIRHGNYSKQTQQLSSHYTVFMSEYLLELDIGLKEFQCTTFTKMNIWQTCCISIYFWNDRHIILISVSSAMMIVEVNWVEAYLMCRIILVLAAPFHKLPGHWPFSWSGIYFLLTKLLTPVWFLPLLCNKLDQLHLSHLTENRHLHCWILWPDPMLVKWMLLCDLLSVISAS